MGNTNIRHLFNLPDTNINLTKEEEDELIDRVLNEHDKKAAEHLIASQFKNILWLANKYSKINPNINKNDLIQEGIIGVLKAIKLYKKEKDNRLSTYSMPWIKHEILNYIVKNFHIISPIKTKTQRRIFFNLKRELSQLNFKNTAEENTIIAKKMDVPIKDVEEVRNIIENQPYDIEVIEHQPIEEEGYIKLEREEERALVNEVINNLTPEEKYIIHKRFIEDKKTPRDKIGEFMGVSAEAIRKRENNIINKIKKSIKDKII